MVGVTTDYISVGGNRHPGAADWDVQTGVLAFGADNNVALWDPLVSSNMNDGVRSQELITSRMSQTAEPTPCLSAIPTK